MAKYIRITFNGPENSSLQFVMNDPDGPPENIEIQYMNNKEQHPVKIKLQKVAEGMPGENVPSKYFR